MSSFGRLSHSLIVNLCAVSVLLPAGGTGVEAQNLSEPLGTQVTAARTCGYYAPMLSGDEQWIAATTDCPDGETIPVHHVVRIERTSQHIERVTPPGVFSEAPSISANGGRVVFLSIADLAPGQNPDHVLQLFLYETVARRYIQLTHFQPTDAHRTIVKPRLSGNGDSVVLVSDADLVPGQNEDGNEEVFVLDLIANRVKQITHTTTPALHQWPVIAHDGEIVLFVENLQPDLPGGATKLFAWTRRTGEIHLQADPHASITPGVFEWVALAPEGHRAVFTSRVDFLGENPDHNFEVYTVDIPIGTIRQVTHSSVCLNLRPTLSADGRWLVFVSNCEYDALNADRDGTLFAMRVDTGEMVQLIQAGPSLTGIEMDVGGRSVVLAMGGDLPGVGRTIQQVFMAKLPARNDEPIASPKFVAPDDVSGVVVSVHDPAVMYLLTRRWGIFKSIDAGRSWKLASYRLGSESVTCMVEDPARPNVLYVGTANAGLYRTSNGGEHWVPMRNLTSQRILRLATDPITPSGMYAWTDEGLFWTPNAGSNWEPTRDHSLSRGDSYRTTSLSQAEPPSGNHEKDAMIPVSKPAGDILRMVGTDVFMLEDGAWSPVPTPDVPHWVAVGPSGRPWLIGTPQGVYRSENPKQGWSAVSSLPAELPAPVVFGPGSTAFAASQEGLYRSVDHGASWARVKELEEFTSLISDPSQPSVLIAGSITRGLMLSRDGGVRWESLKIQPPSRKGLESILKRPATR